jgi:outer membrane translocation and assembly module TamA
VIPLIKQFALGGVGSLRGYAEQALNKGTSIIRNSLSYLNYRTQVDVPVAGSLKLGLFLDGGNLYVDEASLTGFKYGAGLGLHYVTPVGAINFDWGFKVDPKPKDDPYVIHISVGVI